MTGIKIRLQARGLLCFPQGILQAPGDKAQREHAHVREHKPGLCLALAAVQVGPGGEAVGKVVFVVERNDDARLGLRG